MATPLMLRIGFVFDNVMTSDTAVARTARRI